MRWAGTTLIVLLAITLGGCGGPARSDQPSPATPAPASTPATTTETTCPVCKQSVPVDAKYCRKCGSRLK